MGGFLSFNPSNYTSLLDNPGRPSGSGVHHSVSNDSEVATLGPSNPIVEPGAIDKKKIKNTTAVGPHVPYLTESTPNFRTGAPTLPPISRDQESNGVCQAAPSQAIPLIASSLFDNSDRPSNSDAHHSVSDQTEVANPGPSSPVVEPGAMYKKKSKLKSRVVSGAKFILYGIKESADAFGPLKSVAGGLCFILDNCEVRPFPALAVHDAYRHSSKRSRIRSQ